MHVYPPACITSRLYTDTAFLQLFLLAGLPHASTKIHLDLLPLLFANLHLASLQRPERNQALTRHLYHTRARDPPHVDADAA